MQGVGSAIVWPNATAIIFNTVQPNKKAQAIGILAGVVGLGVAIGPLLAGFLATTVGWRWFFTINFPLGTIVAIYLMISSSQEKNKAITRTVDYIGMILFSILIMDILLLIRQFKVSINFYLLLMFVFAIILAGIFYLVERRKKYPLIDFMLFKNVSFFVGCIVRWLTNFAFYVLLFVLGLYLHIVIGCSAFKTGIIFLPMTIIIAIFSPIAGKIINKIGPFWPLIIGLLLSIISYLLFSRIQANSSIVTLLLLFLLPGFSYSLTSPGLLNMTMKDISREKNGIASGGYMFSILGSLFGVALTGVILHHYQNISQSHNIKLILLNSFPSIMYMCISVAILGIVVLFLGAGLMLEKKYTFRIGKQKDLNFIYESLIEMAKEEGIFDKFSQTIQSLDALLFSQNPIAKVLLIEKGKESCGLLLFSDTNRNFIVFGAPGIYIHDVYVCPEYRRQKIATLLFQKIKMIAAERGCSRVDWIVLKNNAKAIEFYKSLGDAEEVDHIKFMRINLHAPRKIKIGGGGGN